MSTAWKILCTRCKQLSIFFSKCEPLRKVKEILSPFLWPQCFFSCLLFFHLSPLQCRNQNRFDHAPKKKNQNPRCRETCICPTVGVVCPTVGASWPHRSSSFRNLANFWTRKKTFAPKKAWNLGFAKTQLPHKKRFVEHSIVLGIGHWGKIAATSTRRATYNLIGSGMAVKNVKIDKK